VTLTLSNVSLGLFDVTDRHYLSSLDAKNPKRGGKTRLEPKTGVRVHNEDALPHDTGSTRHGTIPSRSGINVTGCRGGPESNALLWRIGTVTGLCWVAPQS
jgi:hypothetical protein